MTPEIQRLQVLNDLVAQAIDALGQRAALGQLGVLPQYGLAPQVGISATPWLAQIPAVQGMQARAAQVPISGWTTGLTHTPFQLRPEAMMQPYGFIQPAIQPQVSFGAFPTPYVQPAAQIGAPAFAGGLMHTPYVAPQIGLSQFPYGVAYQVSPWISGQRI